MDIKIYIPNLNFIDRHLFFIVIICNDTSRGRGLYRDLFDKKKYYADRQAGQKYSWNKKFFLPNKPLVIKKICTLK